MRLSLFSPTIHRARWLRPFFPQDTIYILQDIKGKSFLTGRRPPLRPVPHHLSSLEQRFCFFPGGQCVGINRDRPDFPGNAGAVPHGLQVGAAIGKLLQLLIIPPQGHGIVHGPEALLFKGQAVHALKLPDDLQCPGRQQKEAEWSL